MGQCQESQYDRWYLFLEMFTMVSNKKHPIAFLNFMEFKVTLWFSEESLVEIPA